MIIPTAGRLDAISRMNNAAFGYMSAANSLQNLISFNGLQNQSLESLNAADKSLTLSMLQNSLIYKISALREKSCKKLQDENIKRSFSTFA